jgi:hypothetical protein
MPVIAQLLPVTDRLSIPNLVISALILLIMALGKTLIIIWIMRLQREQHNIHERINSLCEQVKLLPPAVAGEILVAWDLHRWKNRLDEIEPRLLRLEERIDVIDGNGTPSGRNG